jgi:hypothetical protein
MTDTPSAQADSGSGRDSGVTSSPPARKGPETDRIASLRGATVQFDRRRAAQVVVGVLGCTLVALIAVFTVAGVHSNSQIDRLHGDGVPVTVTVSGCLGLLGGSGSNAAGYSCRGSYVLDGRRYTESLPGTSFHRPGSTIPAVAVPGDPALVSPDGVIATQHSSAGVFVLPVVLTGVLLIMVGVIAWRRGVGRRGGPDSRSHARRRASGVPTVPAPRSTGLAAGTASLACGKDA